ncbi:MAG: DUF763 domain-containing protein [Candidatus Levybacteria bacterium]|nr:DUF763 domain-containing protein [Candidatus Levybacteria bacterium]
MRKGIATFTLDTGTCPRWLFERMVRLGRSMIEIVVDEYGPDEFVLRIADPVWFQSLGTVLAFDWNASGLTTILTAALKEAIRGQEKDLGIFICGGKGKTSRKTPDEILMWGERLNLSSGKTNQLAHSSKMAAKVDSSLVQDGYQIYHHSFIFTRSGSWAVIQQGMNTTSQTARRYHWHEDSMSSWRHAQRDDRISLKKDSIASLQNDKKKQFSFVNEPHSGIASQAFQNKMLNLIAQESLKTRTVSTELTNAGYQSVIKDIQILRKHSSKLSRMISLQTASDAADSKRSEQLTLLELDDTEFYSHPVISEDFTKSKYLEKILQRVTYQKPESYEQLVAMQGVGPKTIRALALVSEIIYGAKPSYEDPARYSFAHGGKDATPYPVDKKTYDRTIEMLATAVRKMKGNPIDKDKALHRLLKS